MTIDIHDQWVRRVALLLVAFGLVVSASVRPAAAQNDTASLSGRVTDPTGAVLPNAVVAITNTETGDAITRETNSDGIYIFSSLKPGSYLMNVNEQGFRSVSVTGMRLNVQDSLVRNFALQVGSSAESVTVSADTTVIQTADAQLGTVVGETQVRNLPLNGRNFTSLLLLVPGTTPISTSQSFSAGGEVGTIAIPGSSFANPSIHGQWNRAVVYMLDGVINTELRVNTAGVPPIIDTIAEFKVQSHNDSAEFGLVTGGIVNVISKSGTNNYHGGAWEFVRNDFFDARGMADRSSTHPAPFRQNQFGAALGGPIVLPKLYNGKNKTFFEFGYESWRYSRSSLSRYRVPTPQEESGDFSSSNPLPEWPIYDPATTTLVNGNLVRTQFANNTIPQNRIDPMVVKYLQAYYDKPTIPNDGNGNNVINTNPVKDNNNAFSIRIDERLSDKDSGWFRYSRSSDVNIVPNTYTVTTTSLVPAFNVGGGWLHTFSPALMVDAQGGYGGRPFTQISSLKPGLAPMTAAGFTGIDKFGPAALNLNGFWNGSAVNSNAPRTNSNYSISGNLSWLHGVHSFRAGFIWIDQYRSQYTPSQSYQFDVLQTADPNTLDPAHTQTGASLASALLSLPSTASHSFGNPMEFWIPSWGTYFQDGWKLSPRLTVNLGLRFDHIDQANVLRGLQTSFDGGPGGSGNYLIGGGKIPALCSVAKIAPCIPDAFLNDPTSKYVILGSQSNPWSESQWDNVGPRMGVAWSVTNNTVVRAGYGIVFDSVNGLSQSFQNSMDSWPYSSGASTNYNIAEANPSLQNVETVQTATISPLPSASPWGNAGTWYEDEKHKNAYSHQWNLEIERQMTSNLVMTMGYVGSATRRLDLTGLANTAAPSSGTPAQVNSARPFPYYGSSYFFQTSNGQSQYNAFEFKAQSNPYRGFQYLISYTWSKSTDNGASGWFGAENGGFSALQDFYHPEGSKGESGYSIPHVLSVSGTWEPPIGRGKQFLNHNRLASVILGNWQVNTITTLRSGQPFDLSVPNDPANIGDSQSWFNYARPNVVGKVKLPNPTRQEWFNTSAVAVPVNTFGNMGRSALRTAAVYNTDLSVFKRFPVTEGSGFEFRCEAFNALNLSSLGVPDSTLGDANFGVITSSPNNARELQMALKFTF